MGIISAVKHPRQYLIGFILQLFAQLVKTFAAKSYIFVEARKSAFAAGKSAAILLIVNVYHYWRKRLAVIYCKKDRVMI